LLLVVAAPAEAAAIRAGLGTAGDRIGDSAEPWMTESLAPEIDMIVTGVGKAQAAGGTIWACSRTLYRGVISIGIGGSLAGAAGDSPPIGAAILAKRSHFADEGVQTPSEFAPLRAMGFPPGLEAGGFGADGMPCSAAWAEALLDVCDRAAVIATVSTCSGTDAAAAAVATRTGAAVENMEGAAVAAALSRLPAGSRPLFAEIRVISNTTGDRKAQTWDLPRALRRLGVVAADAMRVAVNLA
jgi:futalosine hydrolase